VRIDPSLRATTHWLDSLRLYEQGSADQQGLQSVLNSTKSIRSGSALGSTSCLPTLKPVLLESPPGLPPSLSHAWDVHSTSIPVDSCALVMYCSYLSTLILYSNGFTSHSISWSCTVIVYL